MHSYERQLRLLKAKLVRWVPWMSRATHATIEIKYINAAIVITARWIEGEKSYGLSKAYGEEILFRRVGCVKDYAREFVKEVLMKRGVIT